MDSTVLGPILTGGFTVLFAGLLVKGFRSGTMEWGYFGLNMTGDRRTEPGKFWAAAVLLAILSCLGAIGTVLTLFRPRGIGS